MTAAGKVGPITRGEAHYSPGGAMEPSNGAVGGESRRMMITMTHAADLASANDALISLRGVAKSYATHSGSFTALHDVSLDIGRGEFVGIFGQSGSGKSTLLNLISGIDRVTRGEIFVGGVAVHAIRESGMAKWRGHTVGIVFQFFQLLPTLTAIENVMLPMDLCARWPARDRMKRASALLEQLGVADQAHKLPATLSGGQQQRVAIARALANEPAVLLADEPTGNLDSHNAAIILELFATLARNGQTIVTATHDALVERVCTRSVVIADGRIAEPVAAESYA
ncbi:MAG TPA: ABC transporter ATP-binding protein [Gemmatimonadaceae bacterium]|nr:ABC transporter ATP-binding protein [Gemmatimonadaceae bacterium]